MKKFEEEMKEWFGSPTGFNMEFQSGYEAYCALIKRFKGYRSPVDHQAEIGKIELQNLKYREEIARMQKSLRKKNKAIKELNGAVKKSKARLKECEKLRIEANNEAAMEYSRKCEVVEERAEFKREIEKLKPQLEKQQPELPEVPQFVADWYEENKDNLEIAVFSINIDTSRIYVGDGSNIKNWFSSMQNKPIETIFSMKNGYTVAKEKKYLLKHKSLVIYGDEDEETDADELYLNAEGNFTIYPYDAKIFTQSEIDSMETGSYEQIEVEE
ncbi:DUF1642 domain-containing protein [Lactococcus garvieae]|uniref:DUF1642 domain-containing protein n=1 Tax=Lactococcus garvieae TaxID=1363 RepID=A0AA46TWA9_9LACT|nr:DUF1642 domain-containing protein [Lactococcus garvieae]UYT10705.1 DUF1642 domain-containing protein [Lactococcus garvieae]UYT12747.1 DUF1642 domain-containing protein [Lactococcus garvieae]